MGCCGVAVAVAVAVAASRHVTSRIARNTTIMFPPVSQSRLKYHWNIYIYIYIYKHLHERPIGYENIGIIHNDSIQFDSIRSPSYNNGSNNGSIDYATLQLCAILYHHNNSVPVSQQTIIRRLRRLPSTLTIIRSQSHNNQPHAVYAVYHHSYSVATTIIRSQSRNNQPYDVYAVYAVYHHNYSVAVS